jgi:hypothetical protein
MNDHWGYNKNDPNWKSTRELIQMNPAVNDRVMRN